MPQIASYVIVTPAFNEAAYISKTIESVLVQTIQPLLWVIVDDDSTDQTAQIIRQYAQSHSWIRYVYRQKNTDQTYYASNVYAIQEGLKVIAGQEYDYLAILDADISLPQNYYENMLARIEKDPKLGIASGVYVDRIGDDKFKKVLNDRRSTPKALMVFRKECYEQIGGFLPMKYGGEDTVACFAARMNYWKTWSFPDIVAIHNKLVGTGHTKSTLEIRFRQGIGEYFMATHPLFLLLKSLRRCIKEPPYGVGGLMRLAGFVYAHFLREKRQISDELASYIRKEQLGRVLKGNKIPVEYAVTKTI